MRKVHRRCYQGDPDRAGITRLEVAVVVFVVIWACGQIVPNIQRARAAARRTECQGNMKQLVLATINNATKENGHLPSLYEVHGFGTDMEARASWAVALLPQLRQSEPWGKFQQAPSKFQKEQLQSVIKALQCPVDELNYGQRGGLSYVANAGYIRADIYARKAPGWELAHSLTAVDWDRNGTIDDEDVQTAYATGVFWPPAPGAPEDGNLSLLKQPMTLDYIAAHDGTTNTILLTENRQARNWHRADALHDFAFGVPVNPAEDFAGDTPDQRLNFTTSFEKSLNVYQALPQENFNARPGTAARPSSDHLGSCIYGFADGSAKQISDGMDWSVYVRLLTPNGREYGQNDDGLENY